MVADNSKLVKEEEISLEEGDVIILYSDGLTEGRNMQGEMYSLERLITAVERYAAEYGPDGIVNYVGRDYSRFVEEHVQDDDVTLMAVQYIGSAAKKEKTEEFVTTKWSEDKKNGEESNKETEEEKKDKKIIEKKVT